MGLVKVGGCALDLDRVYAITKVGNLAKEDPGHVHAKVYFGETGVVELSGDDARAVLALVNEFPDYVTYRASIGSRVHQAEPGVPHGLKTSGGKQGS